MEAKTYNGWTNHETWLTALWLDNDESTYRHLRDLALEVWRKAPRSQAVADWGWSREEAAECRLAELIQEFVEERNTVEAHTLYADLMCAAICNVNWHEIARHYVADYAADQRGREKENKEEQRDENGREENEEQ
jgi:hypothetical protein